MAKTIQVKMEDGFFVACVVVERLGFNHDIGARAAWVRYAGREFMAAYAGDGKWRKWSAIDRVQPMLERAEREKRRRASQ